MGDLRSATREQSSEHRAFLKFYSLGKDLGSERKLGEGQDGGRTWRQLGAGTQERGQLGLGVAGREDWSLG